MPKLIPKGRLGVSMWVEILLDKYASQRPTERLLESWRLLGLGLSAGAVADGLHRLEPVFRGLYGALIARSRLSAFHQADETRWLVFVAKEGRCNATFAGSRANPAHSEDKTCFQPIPRPGIGPGLAV